MSSKKIKKIKKMIETYNRKASKWGYPTITLRDDYRPSPFQYAEPEANETFWTVIKVAYRDGYLRSDYDKILKLSRSIRNSM